MAILVDTNILVATLDHRQAAHSQCAGVLLPSVAFRWDLKLCAQSMIEFWSVGTRPLNVNGLVLTPSHAALALDEFAQVLPCLPEPPDITDHWRRLVTTYNVSGKAAHDARIVAFMVAHGIDTLLTLNTPDFSR
jgi:predicted nucleic acid-binding protein